MLTFKQFTEARDHGEMMKHLKALAQHPNTPKHEANAAVHAYNKLLKTKGTGTNYNHPSHGKATIKQDKNGDYISKIHKYGGIEMAHVSKEEAHEHLVSQGFTKE